MSNRIKKFKVLIVDDHPTVREALALRISMEEDFEVCGQAAGENEALMLFERTSPDLVVVDISLNQGNGLELIKQIRAKNMHTRMLVFSTYPESLYAERVLRAGALGYVNKQQSSEQVTAALRTVLNGKRYISSEITERLVDLALGTADHSESLVDSLSDRELEVFQLIGQGVKSPEVADRLGLSVNTIDSYREKIKQKIGVRSGVELQREAVRWVIEQQM